MNKRKSSTIKTPLKSAQKTIGNFFKPCERPSSNNFSYYQNDSDSDIEILSCSINNKSDDIQIINNVKRIKTDTKTKSKKQKSTTKFKSSFKSISSFKLTDNFESNSLDENLNLLNTKSPLIINLELNESINELNNLNIELNNDSNNNSNDQLNNNSNNQLNNNSNDQLNNNSDDQLNNNSDDQFKTPIKKNPFACTSPSPYFKNLSDTLENSKNYHDLNECLNLHLEDIKKNITPKKIEFDDNLPTTSTIEITKKELDFNLVSVNQLKSPVKINLNDKKDITYTEANRNNFIKIIRTVIDDTLNKSLFNDNDWHIISLFINLNPDVQSLFIKLFFRKNIWIKKSSIKYDYDNLEESLKILLDNRFLNNENSLTDLEEGLNILDGNEVKEFAKQSKLNTTNTTKQKLIENILNFCRKTNCLTFSTTKLTLEERKLNELKNNFLVNKCFKVNLEYSNVLLRCLILYFPPIFFEKNLNTTLSETFFNLYEDSRNLIAFPIYDSNKKIQVYTRREDLIIYTEACILESIINENGSTLSTDEIISYLDKTLKKYKDYVELNLKLDTTLPYFLRKLTAGSKLLSCISQCITLLEKKKFYKEANQYLEFLISQNIYCLTRRGKWYERLITNYESHLKDEKKAYEYCLQAYSDYYIREAMKLIIIKKLIRLAKKLKLTDYPKFPNLNIPECIIYADTIKRKVDLRNNIFYEPNNEGDGFTILKVEQVALNYYFDEFDLTGIHSENQLFNTLFFLLFYEQIFVKDDKITDIYRFNFQKLPLDFGSDTFYESRRSHFEIRFNYLANLTNESLFELIETEYKKYENLKTVINLNSIELQHLKEIILCIDIDCLIKICRRLAEDHRFTRSGFPDLIVWNVDSKIIKAVEVKGPSDSLSEKQMIWIDFLNSAGLPSEVCYVKAKK